MSEDTHTVKINYEVSGIDDSIRSSQRLLYAMNAVRMSVRDIQDVMAGPTLQNVMWTAIQLTRVWTSLYRLIAATNRAQQIGIATGVVGAIKGGGIDPVLASVMMWSGADTAATATGTTKTGLFGRVMMMASANPLAAGAVVAVAAMGTAILYKQGKEREYQEYITRQREIAKSQGLEV